jgi:ribosomal protein S17
VDSRQENTAVSMQRTTTRMIMKIVMMKTKMTTMIMMYRDSMKRMTTMKKIMTMTTKTMIMDKCGAAMKTRDRITIIKEAVTIMRTSARQDAALAACAVVRAE